MMNVNETASYLREYGAVCDAVRALPAEEKKKRIEAVKAVCVPVACAPLPAESVRAGAWIGMREAARRVAVMCAKLPKEKAAKPLSDFDAMDRGRVNLEVSRLIRELEKIRDVMQGGTMPGVMK